ncbi:uncharacterized protein COLE_03369 [Cutaneotrichosporon oleaginosum]|uniref:uncharacterized protein n=1 Tax=Cutaneotrichosporon oleaginosum TaxID=879819 RepID=UPI0013266AF9|nr:hypothetical protein COLE_03369 [Cutaneotrichosporon oleaginosum]
MTVHALWVINKAGGLVFNRYYSDTLPKLEPNALLILAGTLHGIHAITARLAPAPPPGAPSAGLQSFEAEGWGGTVYLTPTGTKFVLLHSLGHPVDDVLKRVYEIYSDAVMKNPFHTPEMPINSSQFESRLQTLIASANA